MSEDQRNDDGQGGGYEDYSQGGADGQGAPEGYAEGAEGAEGYPEGYEEGAEGYPEGYHGRTGVPDYVPVDDSPPDPSLKEKNTGAAIKLVIGIAIVLIVAGIGVYYFMTKGAELVPDTAAVDALKAANLKGMVPFWKKVDIRVSSDKDMINFNIRLLGFIQKESTRVPFAKRLKEEAVPILDAALPDYEAIKPQEIHADEYKAVIEKYKALRETAIDLSNQLMMIDQALTAETKLTRRSDAWYNAQLWDDAQYHGEAFSYYKTLSCVLDRPLADIKATELAAKVDESCASDRPAWFKRVVTDCYPALLVDNAPADEAFKTTVTTYRKVGIEASKAKPKPEGPVVDELSIESIRACSDGGRQELEQQLASRLKEAYVAYEAAKKAYIDASLIPTAKK